MRALRRRNHRAFQTDTGTTGVLSRLFPENAGFSACARPAGLGSGRGAFQDPTTDLLCFFVKIISYHLHIFPDFSLFLGGTQQESRMKGGHHSYSIPVAPMSASLCNGLSRSEQTLKRRRSQRDDNFRM